MKYGFLYAFFKVILDIARYFTAVEWLKGLFILFGKNDEQKKQLSRIAVDWFILFKWILVIILWTNRTSNGFVTFLTWYLIITNVYSYFYHHIWSDAALIAEKKDADRVRRRFLNLVYAIAFSIFCFAFLYITRYNSELNWSHDTITNYKAIWFSISSSLAANYSDVTPASDLGNSVTIAQLIITFLFVTIIFSRSIPEIEKETVEETKTKSNGLQE